jgi:fructuronate reductase/mannitol 2-dehydrogenase
MSAVLTCLPRLGDGTLEAHVASCSVPAYDRRRLTPSIVHFGVGKFHRSHQAAYLDRLAESGRSLDWGVVGVGLRNRVVSDTLAAQDGLYTLVERDRTGERARVIGSITRCLYGPDDPRAVLSALTDRRTRLVTLTITDGGYGVDPVTRRFGPVDAAVAGDLEHPDVPTTVFGYIVEALARRRRAGGRPFTILSCDNMPHNGDAARTAVLSFARLRDEPLARWIEANVAFPSSMVDRITPETTDEDHRFVGEELGFEDGSPVVAEPFSQWIVEDDFCNGRPPLEDVGVQFVEDVEPYALMKTRLLNASHSAIGYLGHLAGYGRIDEAMEDPLLRAYVERLMEAEVAPLLPAVPGVELAEYREQLMERFRNPMIADLLKRLCRRGSTKVPAYLLPSIREARRARRPHDLLTLAVAAWLRYLRGVDRHGQRFAIEDALAGRLCPLARRAGVDPRPMLRQRDLFGDLGRDPEFTRSVQKALVALDRRGVHGALRDVLAEGAPHALAA